MSDWYILNPDKTVTKTDDIMKASEGLADRENKIVAQTTGPGGRFVSTVFLGLDHGWDGEPMVFETMIFEPGWLTKKRPPIDWDKIKKGRYKAEKGRPNQRTDLHEWQDRYSTYEQARMGHAYALGLLAAEFPGSEVARKRRIRKLVRTRAARVAAAQEADRVQRDLKRHLLQGHTLGAFS